MPIVSTSDQVGKRETVANIITNISPYKTPFQQLIGSEGIDGINPQWQEDSLDAAADNAQPQGATAPSSAFTPTVMRQNYTQIFSKTVSVSRTARRVATYGRRDEFAYQSEKKAKEIKKDRERALLKGASSTYVVPSGTSTAGKMSAAQAMIDSSVVINAATNPLSETLVVTANQTLYDVGGEADTLMIKPHDAPIIAGFASAVNRTRYIDGASKTVVNAVNVYVSPYGEQKVVMNRFLPATDALLFEADNWKLLTLDNWRMYDLAKTGDSDNKAIVGEFSLKHENFKASALITGLTGTVANTV
jgi:hypothetical protein